MRMLIVAVTLLVLGIPALAQTPKAEPAPKLKPEIALQLRDAQYEQAKLLLQMKALEAQYADLQKKFGAEQEKFIRLAGSALKDSGIDEGKYVLDPDTLDVKVKPAPPAAVEVVAAGRDVRGDERPLSVETK